MNIRDESGRHDPDLLREALTRRLNKPNHPYPPIRGCEDDRLVCAMAVVVLSPFLIKQINKHKLDISSLIRDLCERMRKFLTLLGPEYADWLNLHISSNEASTEEEVMRILIKADQEVPGLMPIYFSQTGNQLRLVGKVARTFRGNYVHNGRVYRRDDVEMTFEEGKWVVLNSTIEETAMLFNELPTNLEEELVLLRQSLDAYFGRDDISGEWGALPSSLPSDDMPLVLSNEDGSLEAPQEPEGDDFYEDDDTIADPPEIDIEMRYWIQDDDSGEIYEVYPDPNGTSQFVDDYHIVHENVFNSDGKPVRFNEDGEINIDMEREDNLAIQFEIARRGDEGDGEDAVIELDPDVEARFKALQIAQEGKQASRRYAESDAAKLEEQIAAEIPHDGDIHKRVRLTSGEELEVTPPAPVASKDMTATRAVRNLREEDEPKNEGGDTVVLPPDSRANFDTLSGTPEPLTQTRDLGTKSKPPTLEEGGDSSDSSMVEDKEPTDPPAVGGEEPARARTRTSMSIDISTEQPTKKEDNMSDTNTPEPTLEARRVDFDEEGENITFRAKETTTRPLNEWTDPTGEYKVLGQDPNRCRFRAIREGEDEIFIDIIALRENLDVWYQHKNADQSNPDLLLSSQAPGSDDDIEDKDDDNWDDGFPSAFDFLDDEKAEADPPSVETTPDDESDTNPALPGTVASTEPPFAGNEKENLSQSGEGLENTPEGDKPEDTKPEKEDEKMSDNKEPDIDPDAPTKPETRRLKKVDMITVRGDFNGDGQLVPKEVALAHVFVGDNTVDGYNEGATAFKVGEDLFNQATLKQGEDMDVFPLNEVKLVEVVKRTNDGTLSTEKVNEQLLRDPNDANARIYLNEEMTEFMKGNEPIGARAKLADETGDIVAQVFAPNNVRTQSMLAEAENEGEDNNEPSRAQRMWNGFWAEQSNGRRALHVALPLLLLALIVMLFSLPSGSESNTANKDDNSTPPAASDNEVKKVESWVSAREHDSDYREIMPHRALTGTLDFRGTTGTVFPNAITNQNVDEWILLDHTTVDKQDYDPTIGGFHITYTVNPVKLAQYSEELGNHHPVYKRRLGVAEYDVRRNAPHTGPHHVKLLQPVRFYVAPDNLVVPVLTISTRADYQEVLDRAKARGTQAYQDALPRLRATTFVRQIHMPDDAGTN